MTNRKRRIETNKKTKVELGQARKQRKMAIVMQCLTNASCAECNKNEPAFVRFGKAIRRAGTGRSYAPQVIVNWGWPDTVIGSALAESSAICRECDDCEKARLSKERKSKWRIPQVAEDMKSSFWIDETGKRRKQLSPKHAAISRGAKRKGVYTHDDETGARMSKSHTGKPLPRAVVEKSVATKKRRREERLAATRSEKMTIEGKRRKLVLQPARRENHDPSLICMHCGSRNTDSLIPVEGLQGNYECRSERFCNIRIIERSNRSETYPHAN